MKRKSNTLKTVFVCAVLVVVTFAGFEKVRFNDFVKYDDDKYVTDNRHIQSGPTGQSLLWALTRSYASNWHPVTWISHMVDCKLFGLNPAGHHLTSLWIHILNSLLVFWVLKEMSGSFCIDMPLQRA